ncbi:hypothetical protein UFOVP724_164 [uncultured Caudovirales phage]|uniref:Uncharacterized protein n=1 Tax=uncultured Caudovirales phage TaxID=2100421 RepID=A0A6J5NTC4_9CAUD|nr:hypothetical protein UFOVP724_164 [uncultured Caudovirales phage]
MPEAKIINDKYYLFGDPLNEKQQQVFQRRCPDANKIIASLPPESFEEVRIQEALDKKRQEELDRLEAERNKKEEELKKPSKASLRIQQKKNMIPVVSKPTNVSETKTIIESIITEHEFDRIDANKTSESVKSLHEEKEEMNLDEELLSMQEEIETRKAPKVEPQVQRNPEAVMRDQILTILQRDPNAPSDMQISAWKDQYGASGVHVMAFSDTEVYVYHHITRKQWKSIKDIMQKLEGKEAEEVEERLKEKVFASCVLYPRLTNDWMENCKAGVVDSLYQMILLNSGFITTQQAMMLTTQL